MKFATSKYIFLIVWLLSLLIAPYVVIKNSSLEWVFAEPAAAMYFFQRIFGLLAFIMLTYQLVFGALLTRLATRFGGWVYKFHITHGIFTYLVIFLHPFMFFLYTSKIFGKIDPFYVFTDYCVLCQNQQEFFYTFGRLAFWLITFAVVAGRFRTWPFFRKNWRKIHVANYVAFALVAYHAHKLGSDVTFFPFNYFYWLALAVVTVSFGARLLSKFGINFLPKSSTVAKVK